jgi:hypothetical protein
MKFLFIGFQLNHTNHLSLSLDIADIKQPSKLLRSLGLTSYPLFLISPASVNSLGDYYPPKRKATPSSTDLNKSISFKIDGDRHVAIIKPLLPFHNRGPSYHEIKFDHILDVNLRRTTKGPSNLTYRPVESIIHHQHTGSKSEEEEKTKTHNSTTKEGHLHKRGTSSALQEISA